MMKLDQLPKDCRAFVAAEAKERNTTEEAVLSHYDRLIDEVDDDIAKGLSRLTAKGRKRTSPDDVHDDIAKGAKRTPPDRRARWHGHIKTRLDRVIGLDWIAPQSVVRVIEEREGQTIDRLILDRLCVRRGWGVASPTVEQANYFEQDNEAEEWPTRCRNRRERDAADAEVLHLLTLDRSCTEKLTPEEIATVARRFYKRGDETLAPAFGRVVRWFLAYRKGGRK